MPALAPAPATLPPGVRVYAIGDVHGCLDQLAALHQAIGDDLAERPPGGSAVLVHLGDYIDRGPDSALVVARLMAPFAGPPVETVCLLGNHEDLLLGALDGRRGWADTWLANGGVESLHSWGVPWRTPPKRWAGLLPAAQIEFLRGLPVSHRLGGYLFVHAGLRPGVPLEAQTRQDMLWIREPFLSSDADFGAVVVHGHTPQEPEPVVRANRIGLDTGAVLGGALSCVVLEGETMGFLRA
jgi:serine/threonine protein phosphatase 1